MKSTSIYLLAIVLITMSEFGFASRAPKVAGGSEVKFTENKGQISDQFHIQRPDVLFSGTHQGLCYYLTSSGISYQFAKPNVKNLKQGAKEIDANQKKTSSDGVVTFYRIDMKWINSNIPVVLKENELEGFSNYYLQHCPQGITNVKSYGSVVYNNIYNNIDMKWYGKEGNLEYDFILAPGSDPGQISIMINGAERIYTNEKGELVIQTPLGSLIENKPVAFQNGKIIKAEWIVKENVVGIKVWAYDKRKALTIDPAIRLWGTYYGGNSSDIVYGNTTNGLDESYIVGETQSISNIATTGAYQITYANGTDVFISKFNGAGVRQWGTYLGGGGFEKANAVASDLASGMVYLVGQANLGFPVTGGAHQTISGGGLDGIICKFNSAGALQWSSYYGGAGSDEVKSCAVDNLGNLILCGVSTSTAAGTAIATIGSHQPSSGLGTDDAFLVKFSSAGVRTWGTFYGGSGAETGFSCCSDVNGNIYMTGGTTTSSGTNIATTGAHQLALDGIQDAFLVKFNSTGVRQWGTYYGGPGVDRAQSCTAFSNNEVYISGMAQAGAVGVVSTVGAHQTASGGGTDGFLAKFNGAGVRQWGTYYGGSGTSEIVNGSCVSTNGDVFICGRTSSPNNISTAGSYQVTNGGGADDAFLVKFNSSGVRQWGTYYGGALSDQGNSCSTNSLNSIYISGSSASTVDIASTGAHQTVYGGFSNDGFHAKIKDCSNSLILSVSGTNTLCTGQSATLTANGTGFTTYTWSTASNSSSIVVTPTSNTTYTLNAGTVTAGCVYSSVHTVSVNIQPTVVVSPTSAVVCSGNSVTLTATGASNYSWSTGPTTNTIVVTPTAMTQPIVTGINGWCTHSLMANVGVSPTPTINITGAPNATYCSGGVLTMTASGAITYTWNNGPTTATNVVSPTVATIYTVTGTMGPCVSTKTISANMVLTPTVNVNTNAAYICAGGSATLTANGASSYSWNTTATNSVIVVSPTVSTTYTVTGNNGACVDTKTIAVTMTTNISMNATANPSVSCSGDQVILSSTGASNYTWSTSSNSNSISVNPISSTSYTVNGNSGSCTGSAVVNVTVNPLPSIVASASPTLICVNGTVNLSASGAQSYTWTPGNTVGATTTETLSTTTIYTVAGTDAQTCLNTQTIQVLVDPCTGIDERNEIADHFIIFPNPNEGNFSIIAPKGVYQLINSLGQIVTIIEVVADEQNVSVNQLLPGVYYIMNTHFITKVVITK